MTSFIEGHRLCLRLVTPDDAEYIHALRNDPIYNRHLSPINGTADDQRAWIESYKTREAAGQEYYYVIERTDGDRCGVVRLYEITADSFTWGSWILDENKPSKAALASSMLVYQVGFDVLGLDKAIFDVRKNNERTIKFHRRFGATEIERDTENIYFELNRDQFKRMRNQHAKVIRTST